MFDSTCETNIPILRKPFSGNLPPMVPVVEADNLGGATKVGSENALKLLFVEGRVIKEVPASFNLGGEGDELRCIYIKDGKFVQSNPIEQMQIAPVGTGTVNIAQVFMPDGSSFFIKAPAGGSGGGATYVGGGSSPLLTPVWLDYISSDPSCVPAMEYSITNVASSSLIEYAGKNLIDKFIDKGDAASAYTYQCMACDPLAGSQSVDTTGNVTFTGKDSSNYYNFRINRAGRYILTSVSGRVSHRATSMVLTVNFPDGTSTTHYTPAGQKAAFTNAVAYDMPANTTIRVYGSSSGGWANCNLRYAAPTDVVLYTKSGDEYVKVTSFNNDGSLQDGIIYYTNNGVSVAGRSIAYEDVYNHLLADYKAVQGEATKTDTYTTSSGSTVTITYFLAPDGHKICWPSQIANLNTILNDESIGEAWYYVIDTTLDKESFRLPRTRYGFHGDRGYAKIGSGHTRMYLHFMVS